MTREPGDLPAQSPNRWTGRPYGAVFRSGDGKCRCEGRESRISHDFPQMRPTRFCMGVSLCLRIGAGDVTASMIGQIGALFLLARPGAKRPLQFEATASAV